MVKANILDEDKMDNQKKSTIYRTILLTLGIPQLLFGIVATYYNFFVPSFPHSYGWSALAGLCVAGGLILTLSGIYNKYEGLG